MCTSGSKSFNYNASIFHIQQPVKNFRIRSGYQFQAVYASVSVPCAIIIPSYRGNISGKISAIYCHSSGWIFELSRFRISLLSFSRCNCSACRKQKYLFHLLFLSIQVVLNISIIQSLRNKWQNAQYTSLSLPLTTVGYLSRIFLRQRQSLSWSLMIPHACRWEYMVTGPTYLKPLFFRSLLILTDSPLLTGILPASCPWYRMVFPSE